MSFGIVLIFIILKSCKRIFDLYLLNINKYYRLKGQSNGGLKSHAELIRQATKADKKIMVLAFNITGFAKNNLQFKENYENLKNPLLENYTSLHSKLIQIREFTFYNKERLDLEQSIVLTLANQKISFSKQCNKLHQRHRKLLISKLTDSNFAKIEALKKVENE